MEERDFKENSYKIPFSEVPRYVLFSHPEWGICDKCPSGEFNAHSISKSRFVFIEPEMEVRTLNEQDEANWDRGHF